MDLVTLEKACRDLDPTFHIGPVTVSLGVTIIRASWYMQTPRCGGAILHFTIDAPEWMGELAYAIVYRRALDEMRWARDRYGRK